MSKRTGQCARCRGVHNGNHASYCVPCWRAYQYEHRHGLISPPPGRPCIVCGLPFVPRKNDDRDNPAKCCSIACNVKHQNKIRTPEQIRTWRLRTHHGISLDQYNAIFAAQRGVCAICEATPGPSDRGVLHVDHCHSTGRVRGLLCSACNRGIGQLKDSPRVLRAAASYLESTIDVWTF